jgi:predicted HTH domain antitoxin
MDKRKVISAYRRGFITLQECAQILGVDSMQVMGLLNDPQVSENIRVLPKHQPANQ